MGDNDSIRRASEEQDPSVDEWAVEHPRAIVDDCSVRHASKSTARSLTPSLAAVETVNLLRPGTVHPCHSGT